MADILHLHRSHYTCDPLRDYYDDECNQENYDDCYDYNEDADYTDMCHDNIYEISDSEYTDGQIEANISKTMDLDTSRNGNSSQ